MALKPPTYLQGTILDWFVFHEAHVVFSSTYLPYAFLKSLRKPVGVLSYFILRLWVRSGLKIGRDPSRSPKWDSWLSRDGNLGPLHTGCTWISQQFDSTLQGSLFTKHTNEVQNTYQIPTPTPWRGRSAMKGMLCVKEVCPPNFWPRVVWKANVLNNFFKKDDPLTSDLVGWLFQLLHSQYRLCPVNCTKLNFKRNPAPTNVQGCFCTGSSHWSPMLSTVHTLWHSSPWSFW